MLYLLWFQRESEFFTVIHAIFCSLSLRSLPSESFEIIPGSKSCNWVSSDIDIGWHFHTMIGKIEPMVMFQKQVFSTIELFDFFWDIFGYFFFSIWAVNLAVGLGVATDTVFRINTPTLMVQGKLVALSET